MKQVPTLALILFVLATAAYAFTAAPSIYGIHTDSLEFQVVGPTLGIAHPTGYPLYLLLSSLWSRVLFPVGTWAWRMNIFSALTGGLTVSLLYIVSQQLIAQSISEDKSASVSISSFAALAVAGIFGLGTIWWSQTTVAEVYTLHALLTVAILYSAICTKAGRSRGWLFFLIGLSLAHHRTTLLILPGIAVYLLLVDPRCWRPSRAWVLWAAALIVPLLLYAYIPIRAAMGAVDLSGLYSNTWSGFWDHVLARQFGAFFAENELAVNRSLAEWFAIFRGQLGMGGLLLALLGLGQLFGRARAQWLFVVLTLIVNLVFVRFYRVGDIEVFLLPVILCAAILAGGGIVLIAGGGARINQRASGWIARALVILLLLLKVFGLTEDWAEIDRSDAWREHNWAVEMAKVDFPSGSSLIGLEGEISALTYMQQAERLGQNVTGIIARSGDESTRIERISSFVAAGDPVYLTREVSGIESVFSFSSEGPLIRVWRRGEAAILVPETARQPAESSFVDDTLHLDGVEIARADQPGDDSLRVTFYWRPSAPLAERLKLSLRLQRADGEPIYRPDGTAVVEDRFPLRQASYSEYWRVDERIRDVHYIDLPSQLDPSEINVLLVILYNAQSAVEVGRVAIPLQL